MRTYKYNDIIVKAGETYDGCKVISIFEGKLGLVIRYTLRNSTEETTAPAWWFAAKIAGNNPKKA